MNILRTIVVCNVIVFFLTTTIACHRSYYRRQADADAARLIQEKSLDPHWSIPGYTIEVDPASRMFDPFSFDHPPMPPDDPSAAEFMQEVDGKPGFPHWHGNGDTPYVENPEWRYMLPVDEEGKLVIDIESAVDLALMHSPDYQRELENLYLSALAVSLERFDFETQFFLPFNSTVTSNGRLRGGGSTISSNNGTGAGSRLTKAGITGSNLLVGFANSILWQYSGTDSTVGFGSLSMELIQPLLRSAGRDVILESLTDAERGLLYNVRQLERYRRSYMQQIVAGINTGGGVSVGSGSIGNVGGVTQGAGGVLGLLQTQQNLRIQESNIASQLTLLEQFKEYYNFQRIDLLQLKQFKNNVFGSQSGLLSSQIGYQNSLDAFKITLGLPPDLNVEIRDPILDQFVLIDEKINKRKEKVAQLRQTASDVFLAISNGTSKSIIDMKPARDAILNDPLKDPFDDLSWTAGDITLDTIIREENKEEGITQLTLREGIQLVRETIREIEPIYNNVIEIDFPQTDNDIKNLQNSLGRRRNRLLELQNRYFSETDSNAEKPVIEPEVLSTKDLDKLVGERSIEFIGGTRLNEQGVEEKVVGVVTNVRNALDRLKQLLQTWEIILANDGKLPKSELEKEPLKSALLADASMREAVQTRAGTIRRFISEPGPEVLTEISNLLIDVSLIQALARVDSLTLPVVQMDWKEALEIARENRRDWMNSRAQLVDQWRNIEIVADSLESQLDLTFGGDLQNFGDNPFKIRGRNGQIRVGLQFDAPITRLAERNNYRSALIQYQRTKRQYYQFEDRISAQLRQITRQLEVVKLNFEISRQQVKNSVDEVQLASYDLVKPPRPGSGTTAVGFQVAQNLIRALGNLLNSQNALIRNWVQYDVLRRQLDLNMGTMRLNDNGHWIDPVEITPDSIRGSLSGDYVPGVDPMPMNNGSINNGPTNNNGDSNNSDQAPTQNLPPVGRLRNPNQFSSTNYGRNNDVRISQANRSGGLINNVGSTNPREENTLFSSRNRATTAAPPSRNDFGAPRNSVTNSRRLYSKFDSDLKRARTSSLDTSINRQKNSMSRPQSTFNRLPAGKQIVDRKVNPAAYRSVFNGREKQQPINNRQQPIISPFPFKLDNR